MRGNL